MAQPMHHCPMSVDDLYSMPDDDQKHELQAGVLVTEPPPGFRHGRVAARVVELLGPHVRQHRLGAVISNDSGFILSRSPDTVRGPDVAFVSRERVEGVTDLLRAFPGAPDLAVEVLSPSNTAASIHAKVADYLAAGTRCVWVVDAETETVRAYRSLLGPRTFEGDDVLEVEDVLPGFRTTVAELFEV